MPKTEKPAQQSCSNIFHPFSKGNKNSKQQPPSPSPSGSPKPTSPQRHNTATPSTSQFNGAKFDNAQSAQSVSRQNNTEQWNGKNVPSSSDCTAPPNSVNGYLTRSLTDSCLKMDSPALREAFDVFDRDRDGRITCSELHSVFLLLGHTVTPQEVQGMITHVDIDGNGTVEYPEFLRMMRDYSYQHTDCEEVELRDAFNAFDHNGDNFIDFDEIKKTMHALGEKVTDADVKAMIHEADADHDGKINFEEFKRMMSLLRGERSTAK